MNECINDKIWIDKQIDKYLNEWIKKVITWLINEWINE